MIAMTEAIILAGGLGTRLRSAVPDLPKCMAPVAGRPFLSYVIDSLRRQGVQRFVFSLGYLSEHIEQWLSEHYPTLDYTTVVEDEPLGTGGGILFALKATVSDQVLVANGDTLFTIDAGELAATHVETGAACTLALKRMHGFDRYGVVTLDGKRIQGFEEKRFYEEGLINGGIYLVDKTQLLQRKLPQQFSFEKEFLEPAAQQGALSGVAFDGYFIDIGIPEDFARAQQELAAAPLDYTRVDNSWTLFLDRDGVINNERVGNYVLHPSEFHFSPGVLEALPLLARRFGRIIVVSNQRGVGRGLMTREDLEAVHAFMRSRIEQAGGRIDAIYYCTEKDDRCFFRKPNPGMALQAEKDFPELDLARTIMVGNKPSDMRFGRAAGTFTVFVTTTNAGQSFPHPDIDRLYPDLAAFAKDVVSAPGSGAANES